MKNVKNVVRFKSNVTADMVKKGAKSALCSSHVSTTTASNATWDFFHPIGILIVLLATST